ncbi:3-dehydroquinate synthase, chloroplastic [Glycine soja]|uniref:3-dehydroquinate synthase, chloroplastic n=1 Tax=Glycine soja TaxID=3848 RepID=A0A445HYV5_GLYSO|nr:3-dehydroquinate synthase, chloroplastic [Glycine soja]
MLVKRMYHSESGEADVFQYGHLMLLARRPLFFREINPQPRKHTLWQATSDFTGGQASINRRHFLQCPQGLLGKHFEKLIQCDPRLNYLSQHPDLVLDSPYFEPGTTSVHDHIESSDGFDRKSEERSGIFGLQDVESGSAVQSSSSKSEHNLGKAVENVNQEITSPSSVMNIHAMEDFRSRGAETLKFLSNLDQIKLPGLHPSMSMDDLVSHIGHCISEQMGSDNPSLAGDSLYSRSILEEFSQYLFNDSQHATTSDEQRVMSRVNSLYCLLQKDPSSAEDINTMAKNGNSLRDANALSRVNSLYSLLQHAEDTMTRNGNGLRDADVMSRVNSLYCLLQKDPSTAEDTNTMTRNDNGLDADEGGKVGVSNSNTTELSPCKIKVPDLEVQPDDASGCKQGFHLRWIDDSLVKRVGDILKQAKLPTAPPETVTVDMFKSVMAVDKKVADGLLRLILLKGPLGNCVFTGDYDRKALDNTLRAFCKS